MKKDTISNIDWIGFEGIADCIKKKKKNKKVKFFSLWRSYRDMEFIIMFDN